MVASRIAALSHPMTSMSEDIFSPSILGLKSRARQYIVAGCGSSREYLRHNRNQPLVQLH
jgi:hypothetical protein